MVSIVSAEDKLMSQVLEPRTYRREECAVFRKTNEAYGGLSNMAPGFPVRINGVLVLTVEALYQACRFPHMPEVQRLILEQHSPMTAKMVSKPYRNDSRSDWDHVRVKIMRWCLRLKLLMNRSKFTDLLLSTGDRPIVEDSRKDDFWGALRIDSKTLAGRNVLGRLLMELREEIKGGSELRVLEPPAIPSFLLYGQAMGGLDFRTDKGIQRAETMNEDRVPPKGASGPLFPELFPESNGVDTSLTKPQRDGSEEHRLLKGVKPYTSYKESGLPWLGKIPSHWDVKRAKSIFQRVDIRSKTGKEELLTVSSARGIVPRKTANVTMFKAESYLGYKLCWPGDLVINSLWAWAGGLGVSKHHGIISSAYGVYRVREDAPMIPAFVHEVTRSSSFNWELKVRSKGVWISRLQLTDISFLDAPIHFPPVAEQNAIVQFLDWANGRLDRAIRAKRKVIALLNEQKQAIIHRAVTRGLDPSVPLKPSGVPWLADVPAHWTVMPLKRAFTSMDYGISDPTFDAGRIRVLGMGQIKDGESTVPEDGGVNTVDPSLILKDGDLLFNRTNSAALVGKVGIFRGHKTSVTFASYLVRMRPKSGFDSEYLNFVLNCSVILNIARQSSIPSLHQSNLNPARYGRLAIAVPDIEEQQRILRQLIKVCHPLNDAIRMAELAVRRLVEYRTRLVADVVTGKLDVRDSAAKLPVEERANEPDEELVDEAGEVIEDEMTEPVG